MTRSAGSATSHGSVRALWSFGAAALLLAGCSATSTVAPHRAPDAPVVGQQGRVPQFVASCDVSHYSFDDPIVHPGHVGASHQHVFFGNRDVTAVSAYDDLVGADTSCDQVLDSASYWTPVLLDATGRRVDPVGSVAYYRPGPDVDPASVQPYPPGLMLVAGDAGAHRPQPLATIAWTCGVAAHRSERPPACASTTTLRLLVTFPDCWDGEHLRPVDANDVTSHAAYSSGGECPASHPVPIPQLQFAVDHPPVDPDGLSLSSGPIESAHADFWNAWDQDKLEREVHGCLHRGLVCGVTANRLP